MQTRLTTFLIAAALISTAAGCSDGEGTPGEGAYTISAYGEDFVEDKIPADETDGWEIVFSTFEVTISDISAENDDAEAVTVDGAHTLELSEDSAGAGHTIAELTAPAGVYDSLNFRIAPADGKPALRVAGTATKDGATKTFAWEFDTDKLYENCQTSADVADGGSASSQLTIHADHLFYDDLVGDEPNVAFELIASADADDDGEVTLDELAQVDITAETRYQVGSRDITDLRGFIEAQTTTVGHIDGEGHCE